MRPLIQALRWALFVSALPLVLPATGRAAVGETATPPPEMQRPEEDIGLSPMPVYLSPAPRLEREAVFIGPVTGNEEYDTYGYRVSADDRTGTPGPAR